MRTVAGPGRWVWGLAGLATVLALTFGGVVLVTRAWSSTPEPPPQVTMTRTVTLVRPVTSLTVQSYGGAIRITSGPAGRVQVSDTLTYGPLAGGQPAVTESLSRGHLILADPACSQAGDCFVSFAVTVPPGVAVTAMTDGGSLTVSGTGTADHLLGRAAAGDGQHRRRPGRADRARRPVRADRRQQRRPAIGGGRDRPLRALLDHHQQRRGAGAGYALGT